ncbi:MAG: hypothetical protein H6918_12540 [Sphingomonadaceae bacterium]|nr:hypothetical protein [Sphingomonadaceae bacterium]
MASVPDEKPIGASAIEQRRAADHSSFLTHRKFLWLWVALISCIVTSAIYFSIDVQPRPNGGTWYGYTLGTIGAGLIVWLALLGIRKRNMSEGHWSLKAWTSAHVYLGLSLIVIATLHTGFQLGWNVHTLAYVLMMLVILSGIYGIIAYVRLPQALSDNRKEMTTEMMVEALDSIDGQLRRAAQPLDRHEADTVIAALEQDTFGAGMWRRLTNSYGNCATAAALDAFSGNYDADSAHERVRALLARRKAQLDQIRRHMKIKAMLEVWLFIHIPVTIALLAALTAHIISVFYYW